MLGLEAPHLDTHVVDCPTCYMTARAIAAHQDAYLYPGGRTVLDLSPTEMDDLRNRVNTVPAYGLAVATYDHFVKYSCDGRARFGNTPLIKAGTA